MTKKNNNQYMTQSEYARYVGVTRGAIHIAIKISKKVIRTEGGIDPNHPVNLKYQANIELRNSGNKKEVSLGKAIIKELGKPGVAEALLQGIQGLSGEASQAEQTTEPIDKPQKSNKPPPPPQKPAVELGNQGNKLSAYDPAVLEEHIEDTKLKNQLSLVNIQQKQVNLAASIKELVPREFVANFFGKVAGDIQNYFMPMDTRLSPTIMAACEINDPVIRMKIEKIISDEVTTALIQVKARAESFANALLEPL